MELLLILILIGFIPAEIARSKGYSFYCSGFLQQLFSSWHSPDPLK